MTTYIALLRAVNVGGTGKLGMADLKTMCAEAGFGPFGQQGRGIGEGGGRDLEW